MDKKKLFLNPDMPLRKWKRKSTPTLKILFMKRESTLSTPGQTKRKKKVWPYT